MTASRTLMATLFVAAVWGGATPTAPADACGVKLLLRTGAIKPQEGVKRSSNPSRLLLVGDPPRKMVRELKQAGHQVDIAQTPEAAKSKDYKVVVTNRQGVAEAKQRFPNAKVVAANDAAQVEANLTRERVGFRPTNQTPINVKTERTVVRAGPDDKGSDYRRLIQAKPAEEPKPAETKPAETKPAETKPAETKPAETKPAETKPAETKPPEPPKTVAVAPKVETKVAVVTPKPEPKAEPKVETKPVATAKIETNEKPAEPPPAKAPVVKQAPKPGAEILFALAGSSLSDTTRADAWVKWLNQNADVSIVIEGHADTTGDEDANMALSQRRAEAVRDHLAAAGIDSSRMEVVAHGEGKPKYGDGRDGRNRRVQITVKK